MPVLVNPYRFFVPATPLGTISPPMINSASIAASSTFTGGHTSTTGKVLIAIIGRRHDANPSVSSVTVGGVSATLVIADLTATLVGQAWVWVGIATGVPTGSAQTVVVTTGTANSIGNIVVFAADLVGASGSAGATGTNRLTATASKIVVTSNNRVGNHKLIVAVVGAVNGDCDPYSASGWDKVAEGATGGTDGSDSSAALFTKTGGPAGGPEAITARPAVSDDQLAGAIVEIL